MKALLARYVALLCTVACATVAVVTVWPTDRQVRTEDRNADGRPDVWRQYDSRGQLTEVDVDSNFDGRPDIREYYAGGELVRRESDRNFDDQVDLVEEFDAATHEEIRSVVDLDYDGSADLLILFRDGRSVFTERARAHPLTTNLRQGTEIAAHGSPFIRRAGVGPLEQLTDPFRGDTAIRRTRATAANSDECVGLSTEGGLPVAGVETVGPLASSTPLVTSNVRPVVHTSSFPWSPRGPPLS
jgi:hypothetical protein